MEGRGGDAALRAGAPRGPAGLRQGNTRVGSRSSEGWRPLEGRMGAASAAGPLSQSSASPALLWWASGWMLDSSQHVLVLRLCGAVVSKQDPTLTPQGPLSVTQ